MVGLDAPVRLDRPTDPEGERDHPAPSGQAGAPAGPPRKAPH
ncbi:hypothetical protein SLNWT_0422 [Streptomyces albus]|uniref:Uncharacterized protein n=1 Tax=Streptomyces albus (strain ATCC 21838 / DSM 41398 / FERM P-419 / JCM 4703 / NBRC 107858) TaxID=1081613 RepID=A0A0B5EFK4_STRA4|nr:hypothetical protein SLNWT_0422 [Streptomyces albus]AOU75109.1 hypothetical protein SLNHY_0418 [Streptomyces albus]AYN30916.1 hypothetical protein DUI70_0413 [Streptomyces albus]